MRSDRASFLIFHGVIGPTIVYPSTRELTLCVDALPCTLGRAPTSMRGPGQGKHLLVDDGDTTLSREHANISWNNTKGCFEIECLSKNGIVINNVRVKKGETSEIHMNTAIRLGAARLYTSLPVGLVEGPAEEKVVKKRKAPAPGPAPASTAQSAATLSAGSAAAGNDEETDVPATLPLPLPAAKRTKANLAWPSAADKAGGSDAGQDSKYFIMLTQAFASGDLPVGPEGPAGGHTQAQLNAWVSENLGVEVNAVVKKGIYSQLNTKKFERVEPALNFGKKGPVLWKPKQ